MSCLSFRENGAVICRNISTVYYSLNETHAEFISGCKYELLHKNKLHTILSLYVHCHPCIRIVGQMKYKKQQTDYLQ